MPKEHNTLGLLFVVKKQALAYFAVRLQNAVQPLAVRYFMHICTIVHIYRQFAVFIHIKHRHAYSRRLAVRYADGAHGIQPQLFQALYIRLRKARIPSRMGMNAP